MKTSLEFVSLANKSIGFLLNLLTQNWKVKAINFKWTSLKVSFELFLLFPPQIRRAQFLVWFFSEKLNEKIFGDSTKLILMDF